MDVFVDLWSPARDLGIARKLADASDRSAPGALLTVVDSGSRAELPQGSRGPLSIPATDAARGFGPIILPAAGFAQNRPSARPTRFPLCSKSIAPADCAPGTHSRAEGGVRLFVRFFHVARQRLRINRRRRHIRCRCARSVRCSGFTSGDRRSRGRLPTASGSPMRTNNRQPFKDAIDSLATPNGPGVTCSSVTPAFVRSREFVRAALSQPCGSSG